MKRETFYTAEKLGKIPGLVHGFGRKEWNLKAIQNDPRLKTFGMVMLRQIHSATVRVITSPPAREIEGDALITRQPGILLVVKTADCLPVLLADPVKAAVAAAHCGWRGTTQHLLDQVVQTMEREFGSRPADLLAVLGPSISGRCYEVGSEIIEAYPEFSEEGSAWPHPQKENKYFLDIRKANGIQLQRAGVKDENIGSLSLCTHCIPHFYSYRRDREKTGRLLNFIGRLPEEE